MKILVTDGENRSALATTRSLGRSGYRVLVAGKNPGNLSASSKYCLRAFTTPDPLNDSESYTRSIAEIVDRERIDVIFPMTEQSICCLNKSREQYGKGVVLACAPQPKMEAVSNKYRLFQLAEKLGVSIPETIYVMGVDDFFGREAQVHRYPVVVKPAFSKIEDGKRIISAGVMYAANKDELSRLYETKPELRHPSLIQEVIEGEGTGLFTLFDTDHHLALFSHRRLLEKPPSGGVSVISESIPLDSEMVKTAEKLLTAVGWEGVAMVEYKRDIRDGRAKLMEINGRLWGSLQLAVSSGMNFPTLCLDYWIGKRPISLLSNYSVEHKMKWFFGVLDHLIIRIKKGDAQLNLPPHSFTRRKVAMELLRRGGANMSFDVYDSEDVKPLITEAKSYIKNLF